MSGPVVGLLGIGAMFCILFFLRIPAAFVMTLVGFVGIALVTSIDAAFSIVGTEMWNIFSNYGLTVIPLFILVGEIVHYAGYNFSIYDATYKWFGHFRGGLAMTTIMASAAFSAISGSNTATAATMSAVAIPAMKEYKYHPMLNAGAVSAGATLGVLIPPSLVLVVYGLYTGQSIGKLFFGNIIPSVILTVAILATVAWICRLHPDWGAAGPRFGWKERMKALPEAVDILVLFGIIMYALFTGVVTATEAAAVSCFLAYAICLARRKLTWKKFVDSMTDTLRISCMVFMIVAGAVIFARFLTLTRLPFEIAEWIGALTLPRWMVLCADPPVLHRRGVRHGRARVPAGVAPDLLSPGRPVGLRPDLVRAGGDDRDHDGGHHASHRHLLLRRVRHVRHPAVDRFPRMLLLFPRLRRFHRHPHDLPVLDGDGAVRHGAVAGRRDAP